MEATKPSTRGKPFFSFSRGVLILLDKLSTDRLCQNRYVIPTLPNVLQEDERLFDHTIFYFPVSGHMIPNILTNIILGIGTNWLTVTCEQKRVENSFPVDIERVS